MLLFPKCVFIKSHKASIMIRSEMTSDRFAGDIKCLQLIKLIQQYSQKIWVSYSLVTIFSIRKMDQKRQFLIDRFSIKRNFFLICSDSRVQITLNAQLQLKKTCGN